MKQMKTLFAAKAIAAALTVLMMTVVGNTSSAIAADKLEIKKVWLRATPPAAKAGGGFLVITNNTDQDEVLKAVKFDGARRSEVHEIKVADGVMEMRPLDDGLVIPAGQTVMLKPGGYHLMFMGLKAPLEAGTHQDITLVFKNSGEMKMKFPVLKMDEGKTLMQGS